MRVWTVAGLLVVLLGAVSWGGGQALEQGAQSGFAELQKQGEGSLQGARAAGFPTRIGVDLTGLAFTGSGGGFGWKIPAAEISAPLWAPWSWRADLGLPQEISLAGERFVLNADAAVGTMRLGVGVDLPLRAVGADLQAMTLSHDRASAPSLAVQGLKVGLERASGANLYHLSAGLADLTLPPRLVAALAPQARFSGHIESFTLDADLSFAASLALMAQAAPQLRRIDIAAAQLSWGGHVIAATGGLEISPEGWPEGTVTLAFSDWADWLALAIGAGWLGKDQLPVMLALGRGLAQQSPDGRVHLPLSFHNKGMFFAGLPLGAAPRLGAQRQ